MFQNLVTGDLDAIRLEMATHFWGTLFMTRAFAPILARNGGGALLNVLSIGSFQVFPGNGAYAAAKAAEWQLTNSTRLELAAQGTQVLGLHLSATDTEELPQFQWTPEIAGRCPAGRMSTCRGRVGRSHRSSRWRLLVG